jgi:hypothetical protein
MFVVAAAATVEPETAEAEVSPAAAGLRSLELAEPAAAEVPQRARGGSKWVIDENEVLHSTLEHKAWTYGCMALLAGGLAEAASNVHSAQDAAVVGGAVFAAYVLSDLGTAVFHHAVDNYGECATLGRGRIVTRGHVRSQHVGMFAHNTWACLLTTRGHVCSQHVDMFAHNTWTCLLTTRGHVCSQQEWHCLPRQEMMGQRLGYCDSAVRVQAVAED